MSRAGTERIPKRISVPVLAALALVLLVPSAASAANSLAVHGSVNQVYVTGAQPGTSLRLVRKGKTVSKKPVGSLGGVLFRQVAAGKGYRVRAADGSLSVPVGVMRDRSAPKDPSIYNQTLPAGGYGYLTTRDGTSLAIDVRLPGPASAGPYPTLVEYSGYGYANPAGAQSGISQILNLLGYAVVDVNMRGTGCSGGAFDYFERLQSLDGYDVVETVARQPWVLNGQGRHGRRLLWRHQPALRRRYDAAPPGRDHAAIGDRQHRDDPLPGRPAQHRLRGAVGPGPGRRREARLAD